jgi:hypothetical protein
MQKELKFTPIGETAYYSKNASGNECTMFVHNKFRLAYYVTVYNVYAYYMGTYYISDIVQGLEEIDIMQAILAQCSDSRKFAKGLDVV